MIVITYESCKGGTNNLAVAIETKTGEFATSEKGAEQAKRNLLRRLRGVKKVH